MAWSDASQRLEAMPVVRTGRDFAVPNRSTLSTSTTAACRCRDQSLTAGGLIYDHVSLNSMESGRYDFLLTPSGHPRGTDLGQQMDIEFISKDHYLMRLQVLHLPPNPGQAFHALRIVIFGDQLGPFP